MGCSPAVPLSLTVSIQSLLPARAAQKTEHKKGRMGPHQAREREDLRRGGEE